QLRLRRTPGRTLKHDARREDTDPRLIAVVARPISSCELDGQRLRGPPLFDDDDQTIGEHLPRGFGRLGANGGLLAQVKAGEARYRRGGAELEQAAPGGTQSTQRRHGNWLL